MKKDKFVEKDTEIVSMALWLKKENVVVIGDLHLGQEEELNKSGILLPRQNFKKVMSEMAKIFSKTGKVEHIILLGDIKHEFCAANNQEWKEVIALLDYLEKKCERIILLKGNHDNYITAIAKWKNFEVVEKFEKGNYCFCHGNKIIETKKKNIIIGHEHTAINLKDKYKQEKFKCFVKTKKFEKIIIALPSFNFLSFGTDVLREKLISKYLKDMKTFEVWVLEGEKSFYFGKMKRK